MKIICFGDSLTSCGGENGRYSDILQDRFPAHAFINAGVGGESFVEALQRIEADVLSQKPDIVLLEFGANDWWRDERPYTAWARDLEACITRIQRIGARVIVLGVFGEYRDINGNSVAKSSGIDERAIAYKKLEEEIARRHDCPYIANIQQNIIGNRRCWTDPNHPNEYGNRYVADMITPMLEEMLAQRALPVRLPALETTRDFWREAVALAPEKLAVVDGDRRLTYAEADIQVEKLAAGIFALTGAERPKIAVYLPNCLDYYLIYWAVQRLGGVIVPLNTWLKEDSIAGIFQSVKPAAVIVRNSLDSVAINAAGNIPVVALEPAGTEMLDYATLFDAPHPAPEISLGGDDLSIIMHTSGTTSTPKGAMMRHSDLMFNVAAAINAQDFSPADVHLLVNPMFHCTALYSSLPTAAYQKTPVIISANSEPDALMPLIQREKITTFLSVPSVFQKILAMKNLDDFDWSTLRVMAFAGSPMPPNAVIALRAKFPGVALHNFFGLTETISMTHVMRNDDIKTRPDSIGKLLPFVEAIIVDENDRSVPPGTPGELLFGREEIIPGYYNQPERLREAIVTLDGREWFRTGDLAAVDEEGFFFIKGRKKDMIIVGGENVFAAEVEAVLAAHPKVREAAVKGVPATGARAMLGELVKAFVVPADPTLSDLELKRHCYEQLPSYKVPAFIVFLDTLPRNPAGKVVKDDLP